MDAPVLSLNHICAPRLRVGELLALSSRVGFSGIELRNDLTGGDPLGGETADTIARAARDFGQTIFTINALQRCDDARALGRLQKELTSLIGIARSVDAKAIVLCPTNDPRDLRSAKERDGDLVHNLRSFAPLFANSGIRGLLEPLGFESCALRSVKSAFRAIAESEAECYGIVHDTFHHAIGPDPIGGIRETPVSAIGLVHVSWTDRDLSPSDYTDENRILFTEKDHLENSTQLRILFESGFGGVVSIEPFSPAVHEMGRADLEAALRRSGEAIQKSIR